MENTSLLPRVRQCLEHYVKKDDVVLAAVSGGADSMAMLDLLLNEKQTLGYRLEVIHIHHHLRSASDAEWDFVKDYCDKRQVPFHGRHLDPTNYAKGSMEAVAHRLRYEAFNDVADALSADWICLAHHANDRAETLLNNLLRGTSTAGLAAMPERNGKLLRPLIHISRDEIEAYCGQRDIPYVTDETNADTAITRNRIRHELMPVLSAYNPEIVQALNRLADSAEQEQDFLQQEAHALAEKALRFRAERWRMFDAKLLRHAHPACFATLLRNELQSLVAQRSPLHAEMVAQCQRLLHEGGQYDLGAGVIFEATRRYVYIGYRPNEIWRCKNGIWRHDFLEAECSADESMLVRTAQPGDTIQLKNLGYKKVKKIFQEAGIPVILRSQWPIICNSKSNAIIWIPFLARSTTLMYYYRVVKCERTISMKLAQRIEQVDDRKKQEDS